MIKRLLPFLITFPLFILICLILNSGDIKPSYKRYNERVSFEKNELFNSTGLLNLDSTRVSDSVFKNKLTLVQFSFHACGPCRRDKQFFQGILDNTPDKFQIITISIDKFHIWSKRNKDTNRWSKINIGSSNLKSELKIEGYPSYFIVDEKGKIISRPDDGIAFLRNYYNFKTNTSVSLFRDYITYLKETERFWNRILMFSSIYFLLIGSIFVILSIVNSIRQKKISIRFLPKTIIFYSINMLVFLALVYFTDGREDIRRINTKDKTGLGEVFSSFMTKNHVSHSKNTLVHFFTLHNYQSNQDIKQIPKLLETHKDIQVLSICLNDSSIWNLAQKSDVYFPIKEDNDSIRVKAKFNSLRNDRWRIVHGMQDTSWVKLEIKRIPTYLILDDNAEIIERPRRGIEFARKIEYLNPSFAEFLKYIKEKGGWRIFFLFGILFSLFVFGILSVIKFIVRKKVRGDNNRA